MGSCSFHVPRPFHVYYVGYVSTCVASRFSLVSQSQFLVTGSALIVALCVTLQLTEMAG